VVETRRRRRITVHVDIWILRDDNWRGIDITDFSVEATDGEIGKVDRATYDVRASRIVVDTGPWIFGRTVILPAGVIERIDEEAKTVSIACTKQQVKDAPEYDEENLDAEERHRKALSDYYGAPGPSGPARKPPTVV
jgi:hypothetical protein